MGRLTSTDPPPIFPEEYRRMAPGRLTARIFLATQIRRARERTGDGMSRASLAKSLFVSESLISKWENGRQVPKLDQVLELLRLLDFSLEDFIQCFLEDMVFDELAPEWTTRWLNIESEAGEVRSYELSVINGLLQTEDYARAVLQYNRHASIDLEAKLASRMERQKILHQEEPPTTVFVFDEFALRRVVGSRQTMAAQMEHLLALSDKPDIILQVVTSDTEYYAGCPFISAKKNGSEYVFVDDAIDGRVLDDPNEVAIISRIWESIRAEALPQKESRKYIEKALKSWQ